jgi:hypothetical protein
MTEKRMAFHAPLPQDMKELIEYLAQSRRG